LPDDGALAAGRLAAGVVLLRLVDFVLTMLAPTGVSPCVCRTKRTSRPRLTQSVRKKATRSAFSWTVKPMLKRES
jgi:hypothetical protein